MTLVRTVSAVTTSIHEHGSAGALSVHEHEALTLEVYARLHDRFGALSADFLGKLAKASISQLSDIVRMLGDVDSMKQIASHLGWELTRGGEGNFPMEGGFEPCAFSIDEEQRIEAQLASLHRAQQARESSIRSSFCPQSFVEESEFVCI